MRRRFEDAVAGTVSQEAVAAVDGVHEAFRSEAPKIATRQASQRVLDALAPAMPNLLGGSADLTHSNLTQANAQAPVAPGDFAGSYLHSGHRAHALAAHSEKQRV